MSYFFEAYKDSTNFIFFWVVVFFLVVGISLVFIRKAHQLKALIPSVLISIGIFGTFLGIFVGLSEFNSQDIAESVPKLLDGMKTAFFTSLIGMLSSVLLKIIYALGDDITANKDDESDDPLLYLLEIRNRIAEANATISKCFKSEEEYSLLSQMKLIRTEMSDNRKEITRAIEGFSQQFAKMASESLVGELKNVVDKFNAMLSDLVADTFRSLKGSTDNLIGWQADYKQEIIDNNIKLTSLIKSLDTVATQIGEVSNRFETFTSELNSIDKSLASISSAGLDLSKASAQITKNNQILESSVMSIKEAGEKASNVVPEIHKKMNQLINDISTLQHSTNTYVKNVTDDLKIQSENMSIALEDRVESIDKALESELTKSLENFAGAMTALSGKFVSDYMPLTLRLTELIKFAETINPAVNV